MKEFLRAMNEEFWRHEPLACYVRFLLLGVVPCIIVFLVLQLTAFYPSILRDNGVSPWPW